MFDGVWPFMADNDLEKFTKRLKDLSVFDVDAFPGEPLMSDVTDNTYRMIIRVPMTVGHNPKYAAIVMTATESEIDGTLKFEGVSIFTDEEICR